METSNNNFDNNGNSSQKNNISNKSLSILNVKSLEKGQSFCKKSNDSLSIKNDTRKSVNSLNDDKNNKNNNKYIEIGSNKNINYNNEDNKDNNNYDDDEDIISKLIGNYGLWQFTWTFVLTLFQIASSFHMFAIIFQTAEKEFWCARPSHLQNIDKNLWINLTQTQDKCSILLFDMNAANEYNLEDIIKNSSSKKFIKCEKFEYANDIISGQTLIEEWNIICDRSHLASILEMCFLAGVAFGSLASGWISDNFGRKHVLMGFITIQASTGTLLAFVKNLPLFMGLRFVMGFASMTVTSVSFVLVVELVGGKYQTVIGILNMLPVAFTYTITSGIAYLTQDWRLMQLVISIPWIFFLLIWYCVPESPRWLLEEGKIEKLKIILKKASRMNGHELPDNYEKILIFATNSKDKISDPLLMVFRKEYRMITILTLIQWFCLVIVYFGLALHIGAVGGNLYINTAISGGVEAFGIIFSILLVLKLGLRKNLIYLMFLSGIACLIMDFLPQNYAWLKVSLGIIVKSAAGIANFLNPIFTALQYPAVIRNFGIGIGNFGSGIALILVPYMWLLSDIETYIPFIIMGINGLIGAFSFFVVKSDNKNANNNKT